MKKLNHKRLAEGEVTGHSHTALAEDASVYAKEEGNAINRLLDAPTGTEVVHEEHKAISLPSGQFDITIQREFDPLEEEIRRVQD